MKHLNLTLSFLLTYIASTTFSQKLAQYDIKNSIYKRRQRSQNVQKGSADSRSTLDLRSSNTALPVCKTPLGMESNKIPNKAISATSSHDIYVSPQQSRYNIGNAWCAQQIKPWDESTFLQVKLPTLHEINQIAIQGMPNSCGENENCPAGYTRWFVIKYSMNGDDWIDYEPSNQPSKPLNQRFKKYKQYKNEFSNKLLIGNNETNHQGKLIDLNPPIKFAHYIRIVPIDYVTAPACLRFELYGCEMKDSDIINVEYLPSKLARSGSNETILLSPSVLDNNLNTGVEISESSKATFSEIQLNNYKNYLSRKENNSNNSKNPKNNKSLNFKIHPLKSSFQYESIFISFIANGQYLIRKIPVGKGNVLLVWFFSEEKSYKTL